MGWCGTGCSAIGPAQWNHDTGRKLLFPHPQRLRAIFSLAEVSDVQGNAADEGWSMTMSEKGIRNDIQVIKLHILLFACFPNQCLLNIQPCK
jgi:hypothetical protein